MNTENALLFVALSLLGIALAVSCAPEGQSCTEIGCTDQLVLEIFDAEFNEIAAFQGELTIDDESTAFDCSDSNDGAADYECEGNRVIFTKAPAQASVMIETENGQQSFEIEPEYDSLQPNGPDCPPTCEQGLETLIIE